MDGENKSNDVHYAVLLVQGWDGTIIIDWEGAMPSFDIVACRMSVFSNQIQVDAVVFLVSIQP